MWRFSLIAESLLSARWTKAPHADQQTRVQVPLVPLLVSTDSTSAKNTSQNMFHLIFGCCGNTTYKEVLKYMKAFLVQIQNT